MPGLLETTMAGASAALRRLLGRRDSYCLPLGEEVRPLIGQAGLVDHLADLVNALAPPPPGRPDAVQAGGLTVAEFATFLGSMSANPGGATAAQQVAMVRQLSTLTSAQILQIVTTLVTGRASGLKGGQLITLVQDLRSDLAATHVHDLALRLCGAVASRIQPADMLYVVEGLHPNGARSGTRVWTTISALTTAPNAVKPDPLHRLVRRLRASPGGVGALDGTQIGALVDDLKNPTAGGGGIHAEQIYEMLIHLVTVAGGAITPTEAQDLITRLRRSLTPAVVHKIAGTAIAVDGNGAALIRPATLLDRTGRSDAAGQPFDALLGGCIAVASDDLVAVLVRGLEVFRYPDDHVCTLLAKLPAVRGADAATRSGKWMAFLKAGYDEGWGPIRHHLDGFFDDGHEPFGRNGPHAVWAFGGPVTTTHDLGGYTFEIKDQHLNYFCNSHTYRHLNFAERAGRAAVSMFPVGWDKTALTTSLTAALTGNPLGVSRMARGARDDYAVDTFHDGTGLQVEIGVRIRNERGVDFARVDHYAPTRNTMRPEQLAAIAHLFG